MIYLALDVGEKRIGVARSDDFGQLASPLLTIQRQSTAGALDALARLVGETGAETVVVGLPVSFDGQLHAQAQAIQRFAERLRARIQTPIIFADETLSSVRAEEALRAAGVRPNRIRERLDAAAAAVILQGYLDDRSQQEAARVAQEATDMGGRSAEDADEPGSGLGGLQPS